MENEKSSLLFCKHCFDDKPLLVDVSKSADFFCDGFDKNYDDDGYIYKGQVCKHCNQLWVIFIRRETVYEGLVREITYAKFSVRKFESITKEDWNNNCANIIYNQPHLRKGVALGNIMFGNHGLYFEDY